MRVAYHHDVDDGRVVDLAGDLRVPSRAHEGDGAAAFFEDRVEEHAQARWVFDVVAGVAEPCCSQGFAAVAGGEEGWGVYFDVWGCGVGPFRLSCKEVPGVY